MVSDTVNQDIKNKILDCDIKLTQKLVVDEIKYGFPEELDKYLNKDRLKTNFLTIKENGDKILQNMEDLKIFSNEKVWEVGGQVFINGSRPYYSGDSLYLALMRQLGFITNKNCARYRVGCRDYEYDGNKGLFLTQWRQYTYNSMPMTINFAFERNRPKELRELTEDKDFYLENPYALAKTYRFNNNNLKRALWVLGNACINGLRRYKDFYNSRNKDLLEGDAYQHSLKVSQKYLRYLEKTSLFKGVKKKDRDFLIIKNTYRNLGREEKRIENGIKFYQEKARTITDVNREAYLTDAFIKEVAARNNYDYNKSVKELLPQLRILSQLKSIRGGTLDEDSCVLYCDFDTVGGVFGIENLRKVMRILKIEPIFIEESLSNGGAHAAFFFDRILKNEERKCIEEFLNKVKSIHVEITKFFGSSVVRIPFCSGDYKPIVLSKNFVDNGVYYRVKATEAYFNTILHNSNPPINKAAKCLKLADISKRIGMWYKNKKEYESYYVSEIIHYVRDGEDLKEIRLGKEGLLKDYECGKRWEYQQTDIPVMKYRLGYSLEQCVQSMLERKGTSKDLNGPLGNPTDLRKHIKSYYEHCELFDNKGHRISARIRKDPDQFYSNLEWLPQEVKNIILNDPYHRRHYGEKLLSLMPKLRIGDGSRKYKEPIQRELFTQFLTYLSLEFFGKAEFESSIRIRKNLNDNMKFITGVQFPDIYISRAAKYFGSLLNRQNVNTRDEHIIHFQLEKSFKEYRIDGEERFNQINKFISRLNINHVKRLLLNILQFEPLKDSNGFSHIKNHCCSYDLGSFNTRMQLLQLFIQNYKESDRFTLSDSIENLRPVLLQNLNGTLSPYHLEKNEEILDQESIYDLDPISDLNREKTVFIMNKDTGEVKEVLGILLPPILLHEDLTLTVLPLQMQRYSEEDTYSFFSTFSSTPFSPDFNAREGPPNFLRTTDSAF